MLSDKQKRFCDEYLIDFNGTQAAIRAGYSKKTANEQAARMLANVSIGEYLNKKKEKLASKLEITQEMVLEGYRKLAFYDARKFYDEKGNILDVPSLDDETAFALSGFEVTEEKTGKGEQQATIGFTKKIKMSDRKSALDGICKVLGYNAPEKRELTGKDGEAISIKYDLSKLSDEELKSLSEILDKTGTST